jgi:hypothetical protein
MRDFLSNREKGENMHKKSNGAISALLVGASSLFILSSVVKVFLIPLTLILGGFIMVGLAVWIFFKNNA